MEKLVQTKIKIHEKAEGPPQGTNHCQVRLVLFDPHMSWQNQVFKLFLIRSFHSQNFVSDIHFTFSYSSLTTAVYFPFPCL